MIGLDANGDFLTNSNGSLKESQNPPWQNFQSECRCIQLTYPPDTTFGRNTVVWEIGNIGNKIDDLTRIGNQYVVVQSVSFDRVNKVFKIT